MKRIIESCRKVSEVSKDVKIDFDKVEKFSKEINKKTIKEKIEEGLKYIKRPNLEKEDLLNLIFLFNSVNFSFFGSKRIKHKEKIYKGSVAFWYKFTNLKESFKPSFWIKMKFNKFSKIFKGFTMLKERLRILKKLQVP